MEKRMKKFFDWCQRNLDSIQKAVGVVSVAISILILVFQTLYAQQASEYYGINIRYFDFEQFSKLKLIAFGLIAFLGVYTLVILNRNLKTQGDKMLCFIQMSCLLFLQNFLYLEKIAVSYHWEWMNNTCIFNGVLLVVLILNIFMAYSLSFVEESNFRESVSCIKKIFFGIAVGVFVISVIAAVYINLAASVTENRTYEIIDQEKVIITCYEGKFLVMDGRIEGDNLYITKGKYEFVEMSGQEIVYHEYEEVYVE